MTKKDFFVLLIKVFGLYFLVLNLFTILPQSIPFIMIGADSTGVLIIVASVIFSIGITYALIFYASKVVDLLRLDSGFEESYIKLGDFKPKDVVRISSFILGGVMVVNNFPKLLNYIYIALKQDNNPFDSPIDKTQMALTFVQIFVGLLLVTNYEWVAKWLNGDKKQKLA
ncbi:hypothetical protein [Persicobacter psychrovividus]|uniref:DUF2975 domain-containing protein n=1 Tax=Persicobacter psychrovividus TaxID=387638 RepID=A0ABN6LET6_9BACT|nr:hypothetical protein PEPS_21420 [Persicobacter psychrovividus]